jgi:hypothetical protein
MKKLLIGLTVLPFLTGIASAAGVGGGGGGGGGNPPPPPPPQGPIVVFKTEPVEISNASGQPSKEPCNTTLCPEAAVRTGPLTALDAQGAALDYFVSAKTIIVNDIPSNGYGGQGAPALGTCQLYANVSGRIVNLDFANVTVPASAYIYPVPGAISVPSDAGQTIALEGSLCPDIPIVRDIGVVCSGSSHTYIYNTILKVTPLSTASSPIDNMSPSSEKTSPLSACSPATPGILGPG